MRHIVILVCVLLLSAIPFQTALGQSLPPEVRTAYQSYAAALKDNGAKAALPYAKDAWQHAEELIGDSKATGDLAYNYGYLALRLGEYKNSIEPLTRSADLALLVPNVGKTLRLEREVQLAGAILAAGNNKQAKERMEDALEFAETNGLQENIYTAELLVNLARYYSTRANEVAKRKPRIFSQSSADIVKMRTRKIQSQSADYAELALQIFSKYPEQQIAESQYISLAHNLIGFAYEREKKWKEAMLAYQRSMEIQKAYSTLEDAAYITTIGRWINTRTHFMYKKTAEQAYAEGMCKCWPYDTEENIRAKLLKRVPPKMPRKAYTSGFSIVRFDLSDDGKVINPEVLQSWPTDLYDKSSLSSVEKWEYETQANDTPGSQRTGLVATIHYILTDYYGKAPI